MEPLSELPKFTPPSHAGAASAASRTTEQRVAGAAAGSVEGAAAAASSGKVHRTVAERLEKNRAAAVSRQDEKAKPGPFKFQPLADRAAAVEERALYLNLEEGLRLITADDFEKMEADFEEKLEKWEDNPVDERPAFSAYATPIKTSATEVAIGHVGISSTRGTRANMEDADVVKDISIVLAGRPITTTLVAVCDGHAERKSVLLGPDEIAPGLAAATYVAVNLPATVTSLLEEKCGEELTDETIFAALREVSIKLDEAYQKNKPTATDGTTLVFSLVLNDKLWVVNVGDSRAMFVQKDGTVVQASQDAKPSEPRFKRKIEKDRGFVSYNGRLNAELAVAAAIGDRNVTGILHHAKITAYPVADISQVILACDGLFDVASTNEVGAVVEGMADKSPELVASGLARSAVVSGSGDNVTVAVLALK